MDEINENGKIDIETNENQHKTGFDHRLRRRDPRNEEDIAKEKNRYIICTLII